MATYRMTDPKNEHAVLAEFQARDRNEAVSLGLQQAPNVTYKLWVQQANGDWVAVNHQASVDYSNTKPKDVATEPELSRDGELNF